MEPIRFWQGDVVVLVNSGDPPATDKVFSWYAEGDKRLYVLESGRHVEAREIVLIVAGDMRRAEERAKTAAQLHPASIW